MENWGLITFREQTFFYSEERTNSIVAKQNVALNVARVLAHFVCCHFIKFFNYISMLK
jgi:aminopeptidase N